MSINPLPPQKNNKDLNQGVLHFWSNSVIRWMGEELLRRQTQNGVKLDFKIDVTLKIKVNHFRIESDKTTSIYNVSTRVLSKK